MKRILMAAAVSLSLCAGSAFAKGDAKRGEDLTYTCGGCHGISQYKNSYPFYHVPRIVGQNYDYLVNALKAYRNDERKHPTMRAQAKSFSEQEIEDIAIYLSTLKKAKK
jgi:cytochrome c553